MYCDKFGLHDDKMITIRLTIKTGPRSVLLQRYFKIPDSVDLQTIKCMIRPTTLVLRHLTVLDTLYLRPTTRAPDTALVELTEANFLGIAAPRFINCRSANVPCDLVVFATSAFGVSQLRALNRSVLRKCNDSGSNAKTHPKRVTLTPKYSSNVPQLVIKAVQCDNGRVHVWTRCNAAMLASLK